MKKILFLSYFILINSMLNAGNFKYQTKIDSVSQEGFYKILLIPEIIAALKTDYSDIRIYDSENNEIPYLLTKESAYRSNSYFKEYKIISNQNFTKPAVNRVILENPSANPISELYIIVRNSAIEKEITLKGSDDLKNWFIITQTYPSLIGLYQNETSEIKVLDFPKSNYKYFMLQMNIKQLDPLQILKVGNYDITHEAGLYSDVPVLSIIQHDSSRYKKSFVTVMFKASFEISKIEFQINGPGIYQRDFQIFNKIISNNKIISEFIGQYILSSKNPSVWELNTFRTNELLITIENEDNAPLKIEKVKVYQLNVCLTAQLRKNVKYYLQFGNAEQSNPEYDLKYFTDNIPKILVQIKSSIPEKLKIEQQVSKVHSFFNSTIMWIVLIFIIGLLAYMTLKLTKEVK